MQKVSDKNSSNFSPYVSKALILNKYYTFNYYFIILILLSSMLTCERKLLTDNDFESW